MGCRALTLLDILSSQQFRTIILLTLGLDICQIADLLETSEQTVHNSLSDCFDRAGCRNAEGLAVRLLYECENDLYDDRLVNELAELQSAAKRMLEKVAPTDRLSASVEKSELPSTRWMT